MKLSKEEIELTLVERLRTWYGINASFLRLNNIVECYGQDLDVHCLFKFIYQGTLQINELRPFLYFALNMGFACYYANGTTWTLWSNNQTVTFFIENNTFHISLDQAYAHYNENANTHNNNAS